jgi:glyoxylase-like metal-dependent hydrolase (beta-lactamase superfamily II)
MNIKKITCNPLQENCYVVSDDSRECVIIDCGVYYEQERIAIVDYIRDNGLKPVHLLATHGHLDHNFGNDTLYDEFKLQAEVMAEDLYLAEHLPKQAMDYFGMEINEQQPPLGPCLSDGALVRFGRHAFQVIHTPGHTPGSVVFWCKEESVAFTGDTLFRMSIGRTDLDGGNWQQMAQSLQKIAAILPADTKIFAGHGPESTMADELQFNPYMRG